MNSRRVEREAWAEWLGQCQVLLESHEWLAVARSLRVAFKLGRSVAEFQALLDLLERHVGDGWLELEDAAARYAELLLRTRRFAAALAFSSGRIAGGDGLPALVVMHAFALLRANQPWQALEQVEAALRGSLERGDLGLAWRVKAEALFRLGQPGWEEAFGRAIRLLEGRPLGTCLLEWGTLLEEALEHAAAQSRWAQALPLFDDDAYYRAWLHFNMGLSCARALRLEQAEQHFEWLRRVSRHDEARMFKSRSWCGFGLVWRVAGEFARAERAYRLAERFAVEDVDWQQALRGLGHTLRLAGHASVALEPLQRATAILSGADGTSWVFVDLAVARWANGDREGAFAALARTGELTGEDLERRHVLLADMARSDGNANMALEHLSKVRMGSLWASEEFGFFPALKALWLAMGEAAPRDLAQAVQTEVQVLACGPLRVLVNGRRVMLASNSRAALVLVLLLEHGGSLGMEELLELLFPEVAPEAASGKRKLVSKAVRALRDALGWDGCVPESGGTYVLDDRVVWLYDVREALGRGEAVTQFMTGVYDEWVLNRARGLLDQSRLLN